MSSFWKEKEEIVRQERPKGKKKNLIKGEGAGMQKTIMKRKKREQEDRN